MSEWKDDLQREDKSLITPTSQTCDVATSRFCVNAIMRFIGHSEVMDWEWEEIAVGIDYTNNPSRMAGRVMTTRMARP